MHEQLDFQKYVAKKNVSIITITFDGTEAKADPVPKKEDTKEDKENGGNPLTTKPVTVVSN